MTHEIEIMTWDTLKHMGLSFFKVSSLCREYRIYNSGVCSFGIFVMLCAYVHSIQCIGPYQLSFLIICVCVCVLSLGRPPKTLGKRNQVRSNGLSISIPGVVSVFAICTEQQTKSVTRWSPADRVLLVRLRKGLVHGIQLSQRLYPNVQVTEPI